MALYNIERPSTLSELVGQENIKRQLIAASTSGSTIQSMLFIGPRGTGKTSTARIWARTVNCENPAEDGSPCGECPTCKAIQAGGSMDVVEMDAASNNGVEDVHNIVNQAQYAPQSRKKVFILDEVHMFSNAAWNALLKTIEEPPADTVFILCTTEEQKVPATIISRCRKFMFERLGADVVKEHLAHICEKHGKVAEDDALTLIARTSDGCMRDALSILESFFDNDNIITDVVAGTLGLSDENKVFDVLEGIQAGNAQRAILSFRSALNGGGNIAAFVKALIVAITDALYLNQGASVSSIVNTALYKERVQRFAASVTIDRCMELTARLSEAYGNLSKAVDSEFLIESAILQTLSYESELEALKKRVAALEEKGVVINTAPIVSVAEEPTAPVQEPVAPAPQAEPVSEEDEFYSRMAESEGFVDVDLDDLPDVFDAGFEDTAPAAPVQEVAPSAPVEPPVELSQLDAEPERPNFTVIEGSKPAEKPAPVVTPQDNGLEDLLDLLPKGTKVVGMSELEANAKGETKAVEEKPAQEETVFGFGFDGLNGYL